MQNKLRTILFTAAAACLPLAGHATIHTYDNINLTTSPNPSGGNSDGTGVWFNVLTGYSESRGYFFPNPLFADGQFFLVMDQTYVQTEAEIYTQGFFSRGNGVIYDSASNLNPAYFGDGATIGSASGYQSPGAGYTDLGPTFGNWTAGEHGYLGLTIGGTGGAADYGYAEITLNDDYSITLVSMAYNDVPGSSITTVASAPEPSTLALVGLAAVGGFIVRWRRR